MELGSYKRLNCTFEIQQLFFCDECDFRCLLFTILHLKLFFETHDLLNLHFLILKGIFTDRMHLISRLTKRETKEIKSKTKEIESKTKQNKASQEN